MPLLSGLETLPSVHPDMVNTYVRTLVHDGSNYPPGTKREFSTVVLADGRKVLIMKLLTREDGQRRA